MICVRSDQSSSRMLFLEPKNLNCCLVSLLEPGRAGQGRGQNRRHVGTIFIWDHERFHVMSQICKIIYGKESKPKVWSKIWQKWLNINWSVSVSAVKNLPLSEDDEGFTKENDLLNNNCLVQLSWALQRGKDYLQSFILRSQFLAWAPDRCVFLMSSYRILKRFRDLIDKLSGFSPVTGEPAD